MKTPPNVRLIKATYLKDYTFRFEFNNGKVFDTNFKPILYHGTMYRSLLDVTKFKKMKFEESGDIYWGKDWNLCFHLNAYYGKKEISVN